MPANPILRLKSVRKTFGHFTALHGIDLAIEEGEFFTIVGPSGSGKSTIIRLLVGMDELTSGEIWLRDKRIDQIPANLRPTCMVFQSLALFPHMSVGQNIEFPLKLRKIDPAKRKARAIELLQLLHLPASYYDKRVTECSGGERQRVALARALAFDPEILFFDEPLSALDYRLRKSLEKELKDLHARTGKTFVYITHSLEEALVMSDRIAIMKSGRFEQISDADEIYSKPVSRFVAEFMGEVNLFQVTASDGRIEGAGLIAAPGDATSTMAERITAARDATLMIRPEYVQFLADGQVADFEISGTLNGIYALGSRIHYEVKTGSGQILTVEKLREDRYDGSQGDTVRLGWSAASAHVIEDTPFEEKVA
ncbi:ABC transporter ATP-binding protein [Pontibaca salina]|uniref:ABC transporter ATP-binding protein n=1 Tax=Pontibaca salina TaxID=2795731 RepID=A0A934M1J6_9RHOB|nr:ABC transporter ATP-binding protein [Pontibaca salina]MBI6630868.1 ABC transporter ATP-binding protein [Pontibaca salina]